MSLIKPKNLFREPEKLNLIKEEGNETGTKHNEVYFSKARKLLSLGRILSC